MPQAQNIRQLVSENATLERQLAEVQEENADLRQQLGLRPADNGKFGIHGRGIGAFANGSKMAKPDRPKPSN